MWPPPARSVGGGLRKETVASASSSAQTEAAPTPRSRPDAGQSSPPRPSLMPFGPLLRSWSSQAVSRRNSVLGPFKGNCARLQKFLSPTAFTPAGFHSQNLWRPIFPELEPWAGGRGVGLGPLAPETSLPKFHPPHKGWDPPIPRLHLSYQTRCPFFFTPLVGGLPLSWTSDGPEWRLFWSSGVIVMWLCGEACQVYLRCHLDCRAELRGAGRTKKGLRGGSRRRPPAAGRATLCFRRLAHRGVGRATRVFPAAGASGMRTAVAGRQAAEGPCTEANAGVGRGTEPWCARWGPGGVG